ncbi:MAG: SpoIIIAH-like family protein [Roseburia sp.]|nr:SpoIIIAH-like family protein [Roseburia sp.]MCM1098322.1 SpoIIIAH-like family protein [Ruminococcus flavefaciens]
MKNLIKKNQLMITALAIMIAIAGYLQFAGTGLEEEYLKTDDSNVSAKDASPTGGEGIVTENYTTQDLLDLSAEDLLQQGITEIDSMDSDLEDLPVDDFLDAEWQVSQNETTDGGLDLNTPEEGEIPGEAVFTSSAGLAMLSEAKLLKEQTRAKNKETLLEIINSEGLSDEQKQEAVNSIVQMTATAEKEAAAEILLEAKGYADVVVSINGDAVDVVVNAAALDDVMRAQIEDIVTRKTGIEPQNIIISTIVTQR